MYSSDALASIYQIRARIYLNMKEYRKAIEEYTEGIKIYKVYKIYSYRTHLIDFYRGRSRCYRALGDVGMAELNEEYAKRAELGWTHIE